MNERLTCQHLVKKLNRSLVMLDITSAKQNMLSATVSWRRNLV